MPTEHFLIYYEKKSPAEEGVRLISELLEGYYQETTRIFNIKLDKKIPYYFHSTALEGKDGQIWGYCSIEDIHVVYSDSQKDSSPHELRHFIQRRVNPYAPYFFNEGACGLGIQIGDEDFHAKAKRMCAYVKNISLAELVRDFQKYGRDGDYFAYSFNSFLIEEYGNDKFSAFYCKVTPDNWQETLKNVFGLSYLDIEAKWKAFLCG